MADFRLDLFLEPGQYEEVPLRDRKRDFPDLKRRTGNPEKKAEFIRDVIALANTARLCGKPAYLLFGIDDYGTLAGIKSYLDVYRHKEDWPQVKIQEEARQQVKSLILEYIKPRLAKFELKFGEIDGLLVAYLVIEPMSLVDGAFRAAKQFDSGIKRPIAVDDCWIRTGESKDKVAIREISPNDTPYCYAYNEVPYILPSYWELYFKSIQNEPQLRDADAIGNYIEPFLVSGESLESAVEAFVNSQEQHLLLLQGPAGSGKTTFLERQAFRHGSDGVVAIEGIREREEFLPPPEWIPIYLRLRHRSRNVESVKRFSAHILTYIGSRGKFWTKRPLVPERLLEADDLHWLLYLDGFDELTEKAQRRFVEMISEFVELFPYVKVVLTSRPLTIAVDWGMVAGTRIEILRPLTDDEIRSFLSGYAGRHNSTPTASEIVALEEGRIEALRFIDLHPDIRRLCAFPSYLIATVREFFPSVDDAPGDRPALRYIEQEMEMDDEWNDLADDDGFLPIPLASDEFLLTEPISDDPRQTEQSAAEDPAVEIRTGIILKEIYQYLWERESERWGIGPIEFARCWESTGRLALITDGHQIIFTQSDALKKLRSQTVLRWLLTLGILEPATDLTLRFITEITKAFFAASIVVSLIEAGDHRTAKRHIHTCSEGFCESMHTLLPSLTQRDLSQLF